MELKKNSPTFQDFDSTILKPSNEEQVQQIIRYCYKNNLPIEIVGTGSKKEIGKNLQCKKILDMSNISGIMDYKPDELYITVKPSTPINSIQEELKKNNQYLAFEPVNFEKIFGKDSKKELLQELYHAIFLVLEDLK